MPVQRPAPAHVGLAVALLLLGFLTAAGVAKERLREREEPARRSALERLVRDRQATIRELSSQISELDRGLDGIRSEAASGSGELRRLLEEVERLEKASGSGALSGPGLVVEVADSERAAAGEADAADLTVQDLDLQLVVNALWRSGAEAVAINGRRVASTTAIRSAGGRILVNLDPVFSPYLVAAIGAPASMARRFEASEIAKRFDVWVQVYGLAFAVRPADDVRVPGSERGGLEFARPAG